MSNSASRQYNVVMNCEELNTLLYKCVTWKRKGGMNAQCM